MNIYNKKLAGETVIVMIMFFGIIALICMATLVAYSSAADSVRKSNINYLGLVYHLSLSHHADDLMIIDNKTALTIQNDVIKTLDCSKDYCLPLKQKLVSGAFIEISYLNNKLDYLKIYSHKISSIFLANLRTNPYPPSLFDKELLVSKYDAEENPAFSNVFNIMDNVTHEYYNENDLKTIISAEDCQSIGLKCLDVLHYQIKK